MPPMSRSGRFSGYDYLPNESLFGSLVELVFERQLALLNGAVQADGNIKGQIETDFIYALLRLIAPPV